MSPRRHDERKHVEELFQGELRKTKPPTFDGEKKKGDDVESWLLGMRKYLRLDIYSLNLEVRVSICKL